MLHGILQGTLPNPGTEATCRFSCFGRQILYHCVPPRKPPIPTALVPYRMSPEAKQGLVSNEFKIESLVGFLKSL